MMTPDHKTCLPAPEQLLLVPLDEMEVAELIERHLEFVDGKGRSVHLPTPFVRHYLKRDDGALPIVSSIAQLPIVLADGTILTGRGLNRKYGIIFRVPAQLDALMPTSKDCSVLAVGRAMRFLTDEWLSDVAADYQGKCIIIACVLTILERALLPERPVFFITAGQRGGGKTTTIHMISEAATGLPASAAAWSADAEERRKALFSYLEVGLAMLVWDNIPRGSAISCPSIEKSCTLEFYTDRVLGITGHKTVATYTVQIFTGNNIAPRGDLASRALTVRLAVDRIDPENRTFRHPDPIEWTTDHRGQLLAAFYTLLLGNPRRSQKKSERSPAPTRFKAWWDMVGSAVEFAAQQHVALVKEEAEWFAGDPPDAAPPTTVDFKTLFLDGEEDEEQACSLASVLDVLTRKWPDGAMFQAGNVVKSIFQSSGNASYAASIAEGEAEAAASFKAALELATGKVVPLVSAPVINWRLQALKDTPAIVDGKALVLRYTKPNRNGRDGGFRVVTLKIDDIGQAAM
jgi:hypothetical protein